MGHTGAIRASQALERGVGSYVVPTLFRLALPCLITCIIAFTLPGCGGSDSGGSAADKAPSTSTSTPTEEASGAAFKAPQEVRVPTVADSGNATTIDTSDLGGGWVGARGHSSSRLKFQVVHGDMAYNYDLPNDGTAVCYPLNMGNGDYSFRIMENVEGNSYAEIDSCSETVSLDSEFSPYLTPNIYCDYTAESACVAQARQLMEGVENQGEAVKAICTYVVNNISYDNDKAARLAESTGYIPNADATLQEKKGVCFDYACLCAAMLRSMGLPAQVVTGYVSPDNLYHAWVMVNVDGTWKSALFSVTPNTWSRCDVTFAAAGAGATVGDGTTYTDRYIY